MYPGILAGSCMLEGCYEKVDPDDKITTGTVYERSLLCKDYNSGTNSLTLDTVRHYLFQKVSEKILYALLFISMNLIPPY